MVVVLMVGARRHLGLKQCLQLGGYANSWGGCGSCITTTRLLGFEIQIVSCRLGLLKGPPASKIENESMECVFECLKGSKHCTLT